jgi:hypothetical protein
MTTTAITQSPPTASTRPTRGLIVATVVLLAAIAFLVSLLVSGVFTSTANSQTGGSGVDNSYCRATSVVHYC